MRLGDVFHIRKTENIMFLRGDRRGSIWLKNHKLNTVSENVLLSRQIQTYENLIAEGFNIFWLN